MTPLLKPAWILPTHNATVPLQEGYVAWLEEARRLLGNYFTTAVVDDLLCDTRDYLALRTATETTPQLIPV